MSAVPPIPPIPASPLGTSIAAPTQVQHAHQVSGNVHHAVQVPMGGFKLWVEASNRTTGRVVAAAPQTATTEQDQKIQQIMGRLQAQLTQAHPHREIVSLAPLSKQIKWRDSVSGETGAYHGNNPGINELSDLFLEMGYAPSTYADMPKGVRGNLSGERPFLHTTERLETLEMRGYSLTADAPVQAQANLAKLNLCLSEIRRVFQQGITKYDRIQRDPTRSKIKHDRAIERGEGLQSFLAAINQMRLIALKEAILNPVGLNDNRGNRLDDQAIKAKFETKVNELREIVRGQPGALKDGFISGTVLRRREERLSDIEEAYIRDIALLSLSASGKQNLERGAYFLLSGHNRKRDGLERVFFKIIIDCFKQPANKDAIIKDWLNHPEFKELLESKFPNPAYRNQVLGVLQRVLVSNI